MTCGRWLVSIFALLPASTGLAQVSRQYSDQIEQTRERVQNERKTMVAQNMKLSLDEARSFWPLYQEYLEALGPAGEMRVKIITIYADNRDTLSDDQAEWIIDTYFERQREITRIRSEFLPRFKQMLPVKKVARFYQIESRLDAIIDFKVTGQIPLIE